MSSAVGIQHTSQIFPIDLTFEVTLQGYVTSNGKEPIPKHWWNNYIYMPNLGTSATRFPVYSLTHNKWDFMPKYGTQVTVTCQWICPSGNVVKSKAK